MRGQPHFSQTQFDRSATQHKSSTFAEDAADLREVLGTDQSFMSGYRIIRPLRREKYGGIPEWVMNDAEVRSLLLRLFPKLSTDRKHRVRAGRWAAVIHLYYRCGLSSTEVADEMGVTLYTVKSLLRSIKRAREGKRCNSGRRRTHEGEKSGQLELVSAA